MDHVVKDPGPTEGGVEDPPEPDGVLVRTHPGLCEGWGNCHRFGRNVYPLDEDGHIGIHRLAVPAEHAIEAWRGATACPEHAITVIGEPEEYWVRRRDAARQH